MAPGTGFFLNNHIKDFDLSATRRLPNVLLPGRAPISSMAPTMVFRHDQLFLNIGTPGGPTIPTQLAELIQNMVDYHMSLKQALNQPRYHSNNQQIYLERNANASVQQTFRSMYPGLKLGSAYGFDVWGGVTAIERLPSGRLIGRIDPRRPAGKAIRVSA